MSNLYVNKVEYDGDTLIDLTSDTVTASDVLSGVTFHLANGASATGALSPVMDVTVDDVSVVENGIAKLDSDDFGKVDDVKINGTTILDSSNVAQITVENNVTSTSTSNPLAANMGKELQDQINNLKNIGRFLAIWNSATGLPLTNPTTLPYTYKTGDYFRVGTVSNGYRHAIVASGNTTSLGIYSGAYSFSFTLTSESVSSQLNTIESVIPAMGDTTRYTATGTLTTSDETYTIASLIKWFQDDVYYIALCDEYDSKLALVSTSTTQTDTISGGSTNYKPNGATYTGAASSTVETENVKVGWVYYYDGSQWLAQSVGAGGVVQDVQINGVTILDSGSGVANIPQATSSVFGAVKVDDTSIFADNGVISAKVQDVTKDGVSVVNASGIAILPDSGLVDDVKVNGTSVVSNKVASVTVPTKVSDLTNDAGYTTNTGTVTSIGITMNGSSKGTVTTSGTINLGTVITEHQSLTAYRTASAQDVIDLVITNDIDAIEAKIPSEATSSNQLADKSFVNSSISTNTATFRGTSATGLTEAAFLAWANTLTKTNNDYVFWNTTDSYGNVVFKRYKYNGTEWIYEYSLNNSSFTAAQWSTINSGFTSSDKTKLDGIEAGAEVNDITDVQVDGTSVVSNKIANIDSSNFGKVDDVKVNGTSVVTSKTANVTVPTQASDIGAVPTSRTINSKALSSDITLYGSDISVSSTDATKIDAALTTIKSGLIISTNVTVSTWVTDATYSDYGYRASIAINGVTADYVPNVVFGLTEAKSENYAPVAETYNGGVYVYSKVNTSITIPTITCQKVV